MRSRTICAALATGVTLVLANGAEAQLSAPVEYIFAGAGTWTMNGVHDSGDFTVTFVGHTSPEMGAGFNEDIFGTFVGGTTTATLTAGQFALGSRLNQIHQMITAAIATAAAKLEASLS